MQREDGEVVLVGDLAVRAEKARMIGAKGVILIFPERHCGVTGL